jgi:hypothetical protein
MIQMGRSMLAAAKIGYGLCFAALLLSGCAIADFEPYSGQQQNWPTSPGTFVNNTYAVATYFGYPPRPYNVIGYLDATTAPIRHRGVVAFAARRAKELGADAIIVLSFFWSVYRHRPFSVMSAPPSSAALNAHCADESDRPLVLPCLAPEGAISPNARIRTCPGAPDVTSNPLRSSGLSLVPEVTGGLSASPTNQSKVRFT